MRKEITWISPLRTGIIYAAIIAVIWIVFGILALIFGGMGPGGPGMSEMMGGGIGAVLGGIIMGVIMGFIGGALSALVYNVAAGIVGGVVIELKDA